MACAGQTGASNRRRICNVAAVEKGTFYSGRAAALAKGRLGITYTRWKTLAIWCASITQAPSKHGRRKALSLKLIKSYAVKSVNIGNTSRCVHANLATWCLALHSLAGGHRHTGCLVLGAIRSLTATVIQDTVALNTAVCPLEEPISGITDGTDVAAAACVQAPGQ
ncbi:hypothetical protein FIBSPDRAFT_894977 [Athelia psychrophila]|uniref:Uncharacterized protein n=1 Tax=Athelia psychrophila TaxID=1759441 RepID=A0A166F8R6_9AGAM|nr:hypothetical protein FIBSPDRAFT_894977 [Fibularhizoctonia sp. CBS 109695]